MPTPSSPISPPHLASVISSHYASRTCPPEDPSLDSRNEQDTSTAVARTPESDTITTDSSPETPPPTRGHRDNVGSASPMSVSEDKAEDAKQLPIATSPVATIPMSPTSLGGDVALPKPVPKYTSSFLRNGSKFVGTQQSDRQVYNVHVEVKHVDMAESFICGYLKIEGLTADHPTLTTYFEGEIIGQKYSFHTRHSDWGSNEKIDMQHWARFPAWRPLAKAAKKPEFNYKDYAEKENIFMRWKEYFLVPDHRVRTISGASFEGFYYICFNQVNGTISGIYFHSKSEKFQQLELKHVPDMGCMGATEFR